MGFFLCFCSNSIKNFSFSLFTIVPWSFIPRGCYWQLSSTKREERWLVATASYLNFWVEFWVALPSLNVLFSLVECTASNYSLVEIFVKLFWRWNCYELSGGNIHLAFLVLTVMMLEQPLKTIATFGWKNLFDGFTPQVIWITSWGMKFFFQSIPRIVSFKSEILSEIWESYAVFVPAADYKIIIFSLSVKYSHARTTI